LVIAAGDRFIRVNPAFCYAIGYTEEELLSRPLTDFVHPDDRAATTQEIKTMAQSGGSHSFINRYVCKDGTVKWLDWRSRIDFKNGCIFACARDITDNRFTLEMFRVAFEASPVGISLIANDGRFMRVNKKLIEVLGYSETEFGIISFQSITYKDDLKKTTQAFNEIISGKTDEYSLDKRYVHKNGSIVNSTIYMKTVFDEFKKPRFFVKHFIIK
jgi:PAS domain S-box-containing protein